MRRAVAALAVLLSSMAWPLSAGAPSGGKRLGLEDLTRLVRISDPQISPDGRSIVVVVSRPDFDANRYDAGLVLVGVSGATQRVLTRGRRHVGSPRWSPSGDRLAFVADASPRNEAEGKGKAAEPGEPSPQVFIMPMAGGDPVQITSAPEGVQQFVWRPDGKAIAFVARDEPPDRAAVKKGEDYFEVGNNDYLVQEAVRPSHLWLVPTEGGEARRLTSGAWSLPESMPPGPPASPPTWSPDGKRIVFARQIRPFSGDSDFTSLQVLDVAGGDIRPLTGRDSLESFPAFSPDGKQVLFWYPRDGDLNNVSEVSVVPAAGGAPRVLTRALDRSLYRSVWMPDGKSILVGGNDGNRVSLWLQPLSGAARRLDLGKVSPSWSYWVDATVGKTGAITFTGSEAQRPAELYYLATPGARPKRLTSFNDPIASLDLGSAETIEWRGPDGFAESGVIIKPPGFDRARRYPLVLLIHGGPNAASTESFSIFGQLLAARDWIVFQPNYRGSDNLGNAYQRAIVGDAGEGPDRDVMAGLEAVKARVGVDPDRIAVSGWSYGGYMTSWLIGHHDFWRAAVSGATVSDLVDQYNLSDFNIQGRYSFGGRSPWVGGNAAAYREQSPITYAGRVKTPTLILSDTGDARVPITQSYRLFHALKDNGVETRFIAFPVPGHFPGDPVRSRAVYRAWLDWLQDHF
jgi:dipeptidyl aminopeptidase/acylaminoacyl peptidase